MFWEIQLSTKAWRHKTFILINVLSILVLRSYWLSFSMVTILFMGFITSVRSHYLGTGCQITSHMNETILYFPFSSDSSYTMNSKNTLAQVDHLFSLVPGYHLYYFKSLSFYLKYRFQLTLKWTFHGCTLSIVSFTLQFFGLIVTNLILETWHYLWIHLSTGNAASFHLYFVILSKLKSLYQ